MENTIIAYFDKRLTDAESAELLHRVSISPEIRQLFEDHATLRDMAARAAHEVTIAPELEESLFARIQALKEEEKLPVGFWNLRRLSLTAGAVALVLAVVGNSINLGSSKNSSGSQSLPRVAQPVSSQFDLASASIGTSNPSTAPGSFSMEQDQAMAHVRNLMQASEAESISEPEVQNIPASITLAPIPRSAEVANIPVTLESPRTLESLEMLNADEAISNFEFALAAPISGFVGPAPASRVSLPIFSKWSASAAYNFDDRNQLGVKASFGQFVGFSTAATAQAGYRLVDASPQRTDGSMEELLYQHREPVAGGLFFVTAGIAGGLYNNSFGSFGNVLSAELGIQVPFGDRMLGGVSFVADRLHQSGSIESLLSASNEPTIVAGTPQYNTLAGHIEYGLTYKF